MTAGAGICHSEVSRASGSSTRVLHGVQLWVALPDSARNTDRAFDHHAPPAVRHAGATLRVFLGELAGQASPVVTHTPLLGAQIDLPVGASVELDVDGDFEHGLLLDRGAVEMSGVPVRAGELAYQGAGPRVLAVANTGTEPVRAVLLGGTPFDEELLMWWNFVGRSHDEIVEFRSEWQAQSARFGRVDGYRGDIDRLPAPPLPATRLRPRRNR